MRYTPVCSNSTLAFEIAHIILQKYGCNVWTTIQPALFTVMEELSGNDYRHQAFDPSFI